MITTITIKGSSKENVSQQSADLTTLLGESIITQWSDRAPKFMGYCSNGLFEVWEMTIYVEDKE